jgi:hypothetical protein
MIWTRTDVCNAVTICNIQWDHLHFIQCRHPRIRSRLSRDSHVEPLGRPMDVSQRRDSKERPVHLQELVRLPFQVDDELHPRYCFFSSSNSAAGFNMMRLSIPCSCKHFGRMGSSRGMSLGAYIPEPGLEPRCRVRRVKCHQLCAGYLRGNSLECDSPSYMPHTSALARLREHLTLQSPAHTSPSPLIRNHTIIYLQAVMRASIDNIIRHLSNLD